MSLVDCVFFTIFDVHNEDVNISGVYAPFTSLIIRSVFSLDRIFLFFLNTHTHTRSTPHQL